MFLDGQGRDETLRINEVDIDGLYEAKVCYLLQVGEADCSSSFHKVGVP